MKILKLNFSNINSLKGCWSIDFTNKAYQDEGIFAITGDTGAGKTSILDAICFALYGETPRQGSVSKSQNEIMTRGTAECFSELVFKTKSGVYRVKRSQRRAHGKIDRGLQAVDCEVVNHETGVVYCTKIKEVERFIEDITKMDMARFTRSMMLAQGSFAAFLQAELKEKSAILEQITGSELYSHISTWFFKECNRKNNDLNVSKERIKGFVLLSDEQQAKHETELKELDSRLCLVKEEIEAYEKAIRWFADKERWETECAQLLEKRKLWTQESAGFAPYKQALARFNQAKKCQTNYAVLKDKRTQLTETEQQKRQCDAARVALDEKYKLQKVSAAASEKAYYECVEQIAGLKPLWKQVRAVDASLATKYDALKEKKEVYAEQKGRQDQYDAQIDILTKARLELEKKKSDCVAFLEKHEFDQGLDTELSGLHIEVDLYKSLISKSGSLSCKMRSEDEECARLSAEMKKIEDELWAHSSKMEKVTERESSLRAQRDTLLQGQSEDDYSSLQQSWANKLSQLKALQKLWVDQASILARKERAETGIQKNVALHHSKSEEKSFLEAKQKSLSDRISIEEKCLDALNEIERLEELRLRLVDDEACPLCGATDHPYVHALDLSQKVSKAEELAQLKSDSEAGGKALMEINLLLNQLESNISHSKSEKDQCTADLKALQVNVDEALLSLEDSSLLSVESCESAVKTAQMEWNSCQKVVDECKTIRQSLDALAKDKDVLSQQKDAILFKLNKVKQAFAGLHEALKSTRDQKTQMDQELEVKSAVLKEKCAPYLVLNLDEETDFDSILKGLDQRRNYFVQKKNEKSALESSLDLNNVQLESEKKKLHDGAVLLTKLETEMKVIQEGIDKQKEERKALYGDKNPDEEEENTSRLSQVRFDQRETDNSALSDLEKEVSVLAEKAKMLDETKGRLESDVVKSTADFSQELMTQGFGSEADYLDALKVEGQVKVWADQQEKLNQEEIAIQNYEQRVNNDLLRLQEQSYEGESVAYRERKVGAEETRNKLIEDVGRIKQVLKQNEDNRQKIADSVIEIQRLESDYARWSRLNGLIGSSDGQKYRNFAQGLTFELLLSEANRYLQQMTDRYLLLPDDEFPLEIKILDKYQGDEVRSVSNISGGESFMVSLALALGLSQIMSGSITIESLFLDEGFGTLDDQSLETALDTLAELNQEGKVIGVISHVALLKERISTQIKVVKKSNGMSRLEGPGIEPIRVDVR